MIDEGAYCTDIFRNRYPGAHDTSSVVNTIRTVHAEKPHSLRHRIKLYTFFTLPTFYFRAVMVRNEKRANRGDCRLQSTIEKERIRN